MSVCTTPNCGEKILARGMCSACYSFDIYHIREKHGQFYWRKYEVKQTRLLSRARLRIRRRRTG